MAERWRCSVAALDRAEPLMATASMVRRWVLLEQPGPWGRDALMQSGLDVDLALALRQRARAAGARVLLIRRHGRYQPEATTLYVAHTQPEHSHVERILLDQPAAVLDLDWVGLRAGAMVGGEPVDTPLYLVCTNGKHDVCCAEFGRPLATAMALALGEQVWECSHFGGDRFAGNLVCLPDGVYYGRVGPADGPRLAREYAAGRVDLDHYRGRASLPFAVQAAEHLVRQRDRLDLLVDVVVDGWADAGEDQVRVAMRVRDVEESVTVAVDMAAARPLTCTAPRPLPAPRYRLV